MEKLSESPAVLVLHGPNLNLLGQREPGHYGYQTLSAINGRLQEKAEVAGVVLTCFQSNSEGELIDRLHAAIEEDVAFLIINPAGFTHSSVALRDAVLATRIDFIEVHLSNIHRREAFRHHSYFSDIAHGVICGLGPIGYELALDAAIAEIKKTVPNGGSIRHGS